MMKKGNILYDKLYMKCSIRKKISMRFFLILFILFFSYSTLTPTGAIRLYAAINTLRPILCYTTKIKKDEQVENQYIMHIPLYDKAVRDSYDTWMVQRCFSIFYVGYYPWP
ncbi:hypothetical protein SAMN02745116_02238 [Pilibacter termitis]|uniref:Uncharacterized protein n=1 Tax=Pilibacter termitis TaxID=263852 RepID=A0A1T4QM04_9ENTE|nr:hypothetical protein SAMN02745116_02238 [Pilibacter termitis]